MKRLRLAMVAACVICLVLLPLPAFALDNESDSDESHTFSTGTLEDRYAALDELATTKNSSSKTIVDTSVSVLTSVNLVLNGMPVSFSGEAVGSPIYADAKHVWINVQGTTGSSVGVYVSKDDAERVINYGNYSTNGSTLEIEGVYSVDCAEHQGELDVHASQLRVLDEGGKIEHMPQQNRLMWGLGLCTAGFILLLIFFTLRHRSDRLAL